MWYFDARCSVTGTEVIERLEEELAKDRRRWRILLDCRRAVAILGGHSPHDVLVAIKEDLRMLEIRSRKIQRLQRAMRDVRGLDIPEAERLISAEIKETAFTPGESTLLRRGKRDIRCIQILIQEMA